MDTPAPAIEPTSLPLSPASEPSASLATSPSAGPLPPLPTGPRPNVNVASASSAAFAVATLQASAAAVAAEEAVWPCITCKRLASARSAYARRPAAARG